jgi:predicted peroxiredoxin
MNLSIDLKDAKRMEKDLLRLAKEFPDAVSRSVNRSMRSARSAGVKAIADETGLKQKTIREKIQEVKATRSKLVAYLDAKAGRAYNLISNVSEGKRNNKAFMIRKKNGAFKFSGVRAKAWKKTKEYKGTFIVNTSKGPLVVSKKGSGKFKFIQGPSVRQEFISPLVRDVIQAKVRERLPKELKHEIGRAVDKANKKAF